MDILVAGGPDNPQTSFLVGFNRKLEAAGFNVLDWRTITTPATKPLPKGCEGVVIIKTYIDHKLSDGVMTMARAAGIPFASVSHRWTLAEPVMRACHLLPPQGYWHDTAPEETATLTSEDEAGPPGPGWMTTVDAAATLGVDRSYIKYLNEIGKLPPPTAVGGGRGGKPANYWPEFAVEALLAERMAKEPNRAPPPLHLDNVELALAPELEAELPHDAGFGAHELPPTQGEPRTKMEWAEMAFTAALEAMVNQAVEGATEALQAELAEARAALAGFTKLQQAAARALAAQTRAAEEMDKLHEAYRALKTLSDDVIKQRDRAERKLDRLQKTLKGALEAP